MDDETTFTQYLIADYVLISTVIELAACIVVLVACLALVRRGRPALVGAAGGLVAGAATALALADTLALLHRDAGPIGWPGWVGDLITYGRPVGLALVVVAVLLALAAPASRPAPRVDAEAA